MTDKVQKIKDWISKEQDGLMDAQGNFEYPEHEGAYHILCNLDAYINSLQEESVSIWHDASEKPERDDLLIETNDGRIIHRQSVNNYGMVKRWAYTSVLLNLSNVQRTTKNWKEPVSEDLEKAAEQDVCEVVNTCSAIGIPNDHIPSWVQDAMVNEFIHGAKWQKEKDFQYLKKECERTGSCCDNDIAIEAAKRHPYYYASEMEAYANIGFKEGAQWQKGQDKSTIELAEDHAMLAGMEKMEQQIMAKAVEATFNVSLPSGLYDKLWIKGCKEGDKLLVIKKDEL